MRVPRGRVGCVRYDRDPVPAEVLILDAGLAVACLRLVAALRPLPHLGLATRRRGVGALLVGLATALAVLLPVRPVTLAGPAMRLDAVTNEPDGVRLRTQTRVDATSPGAASRFALYWRAIYPGSALIRRMWLAAIRRRAEGNR